ncbi:MAG: YafY family transcriptional regulator [Acidobacteriota bacterium]|nr:YafY family transcriptional regulator [Acidobacteriota bacterium]
MPGTAARLLRLLSLLQKRPSWTGAELADALAVDSRTVRRDVNRLRDLGYEISAAPGSSGGYRLGVVREQVPPLLLDDEEATAVAVVLGVMASVAVPGVEAGALAALTKLDRLLPTRLRGQLSALRAATVASLPAMERVPVDQLVTLARGCDQCQRAVFSYRAHSGRQSQRRVEPHRLVATARSWYLVAFDLDRDDWRTFRVDRTSDVRLPGHTFEPRPLRDPARVVAEGIARVAYDVTAVVAIDAPTEQVAQGIPPSFGAVAEEDGRTILRIGADSPGWLIGYLLGLGWRFELLEPPEWRRELTALCDQLAADHRDD